MPTHELELLRSRVLKSIETADVATLLTIEAMTDLPDDPMQKLTAEDSKALIRIADEARTGKLYPIEDLKKAFEARFNLG